MIRLVLGGAGRNARLVERYLDYDKASIIAYIDNDENKWYKMKKIKELEVQIYPLEQLSQLQFDYILVTMSKNNEFLQQLTGGGYGDRVITLMGESEENQKLLQKVMFHNFWIQPHKYQIGNYFIDLGESMLQRYQRSFPMFDSIIEVIAQALTTDQESWIIDIGANVGDTS